MGLPGRRGGESEPGVAENVRQGRGIGAGRWGSGRFDRNHSVGISRSGDASHQCGRSPRQVWGGGPCQPQRAAFLPEPPGAVKPLCRTRPVGGRYAAQAIEITTCRKAALGATLGGLQATDLEAAWPETPLGQAVLEGEAPDRQADLRAPSQGVGRGPGLPSAFQLLLTSSPWAVTRPSNREPVGLTAKT